MGARAASYGLLLAISLLDGVRATFLKFQVRGVRGDEGVKDADEVPVPES